MATNILIADSDQTLRKEFEQVFNARGFHCEGVDSARGALVKLNSKMFGVAIFDLGLPDMDRMELFKVLTQISPKTSVIITTSKATVESSIEALRLGAFDYMVKPLNLGEVALKVERLMEHKDFVEKTQYLHQELNRKYDFSNIIANSQPMQEVCDLIRRAANTDSNILISGKSGTGKELVARAIHFNSPRKRHQFVTVNCGAVVESLFESELFGHKKGAFTSAIKDKDGLFKVASQGTLFFDEISCMPLSLQAKILRAIEFKQIVPVGAVEQIRVDIRIIASTNRDLKDEISRGHFREDLYYRLDVFEIRLPTLEERREDIPGLVQYFVRKYAKEMNKPVQGVDPVALQKLMQFKWMGEVRELENIVERAVIFCEGDTVTIENLPRYLDRENTDSLVIEYDRSLREAVKAFERHFILTKLKQRHGHRSKARKDLGLSETSFYRKITELQLKETIPHRNGRKKQKM